MPPLDLVGFVRKWEGSQLTERSAAQQHFRDLCEALAVPHPTEQDTIGSSYSFEKYVPKTGTDDKGFVDVWKRGFFAWEYKSKGGDLKRAYKQLNEYHEALDNPPLLVVCDFDRFEVHTRPRASPNLGRRAFAGPRPRPRLRLRQLPLHHSQTPPRPLAGSPPLRRPTPKRYLQPGLRHTHPKNEMADHINEHRRSLNMAAVHPKHTRPEMAVRTILHRMGFRYRLHAAELPGSPDIAFRRKRKVIFVHGCFWHRHAGCRYATCPKSNVGFWDAKFRSNMERDQRVQRSLTASGWKILVVWQCELKDSAVLKQRLNEFLQTQP